MRVQLPDGGSRSGPAVDLSAYDLDPSVVLAAVVDRSDGDRDEAPIAVDCHPPGPFHTAVGVIRPEMAVSRRVIMAAVARTRGATAPQDETIATIEAELAAIEPPAVDTEAARRRLAAVGAERDRLRERVARLQGRVQERRAAGRQTAAVEQELTDAVRTLSEVETERVAARQALAAAREDERAAHDVRERRLRLEDRLGNRRREARAHLAATVREDVASAVATAPGEAAVVERASVQTVALAGARVASLAAPLVLVDPPFADQTAAASWLEAPVIEV